MSDFLSAIAFEYRRHKSLANRALAALDGDSFVAQPAPHVNSAAVIVKHLAGSMRSRWTDFLTSDGEKPERNRDTEFSIVSDSRDELIAAWDEGWRAFETTIASLTAADLNRIVLIRGEPHTVQHALLRGLSHATYHIGQILYLARLFRPDSAWLTIAPGQSQAARGGYLKS